MIDAPKFAVLIDWDGTLVDSFPLIEEALNATFIVMERENGHPPQDPVDLTSKPGEFRGTSHLLYDRYGDDWKIVSGILVIHYRALISEKLMMLEGAEETVGLLDREKIPTAVVTNKYQDILAEEAGHLGLQGRFGALVGRRPGREAKPEPDILHEAIRQLGLPGRTPVYVIGDGKVDFVAAKRVMGHQCKPIIFGKSSLSNIFLTMDHSERQDWCRYPEGLPRNYEYVGSHADLQNLLRAMIERDGRLPPAR